MNTWARTCFACLSPFMAWLVLTEVVHAAKPSPQPAPTYPPARVLQSFTSNGGTTTATSRLYMFGGEDSFGNPLGDLWSYSNAGSTNAKWTYIPGSSTARTAPTPRKGAGWSCGGGRCVLVGGSTTKIYNETWIFNESIQTWSKLSCGRRVFCPPARAFQAMAYDPAFGLHVMFGGYAGTNQDVFYWADTYTFNAATNNWTKVTSGDAPPARESAAATYVPGVGVVLFGGTDGQGVFNDMYIWNGAEWRPVTSTVVSDPSRLVPSLWNHSMAWDPEVGVMIVTNGLVSTGWMPNEETWYVKFVSSEGSWQATWTLASGIGCQAAVSSPPDPVVHRGARMAFDPVDGVGVQVFFGGTSANPYTTYGNTVECQ